MIGFGKLITGSSKYVGHEVDLVVYLRDLSKHLEATHWKNLSAMSAAER